MFRIFLSCLRLLLRNRAGNVSMIVGLSAIPLFGMVGFGLDYSMMLMTKAKLDHAADAAAIAGITGAQSYITNYTGTGNPTTAATTAGQNQAQAQFNANAGQLPKGTLTITSMTVTRSSQTLSGNVAYTYSMPTSFMGVLGIKTMSFSGNSASSLTMPGYINIYVIVDVSSSMGIGATTSDQQITYNATGGCAVACHYSGTTTLARNAGATLRIDVAKSALVAALKQVQQSTSLAQVAIYTMSDKFTNVFALSNNFTAAITAANAIDLSALANDGGTDTTYALKQLASALPTPGNGLTQATAQGVVMLITDGVQDSDMKDSSGNDTSDPNFTVYSPCSSSQGSNCWRDTNFGSSGIYFQSFDPTQCSPVKTKGYTMMTLDVNYLIPPTNLQSSTPTLNAVFTYVQNYLLSSIQSNMAACATSNTYALSANTPTEITNAVSQMFSAALAQARLTH